MKFNKDTNTISMEPNKTETYRIVVQLEDKHKGIGVYVLHIEVTKDEEIGLPSNDVDGKGTENNQSSVQKQKYECLSFYC